MSATIHTPPVECRHTGNIVSHSTSWGWERYCQNCHTIVSRNTFEEVSAIVAEQERQADIERGYKQVWFTRRPLPVEAIQWTGDNLAEVCAFTSNKPDDVELAHLLSTEGALPGLRIKGRVAAWPSNWFVKKSSGMFVLSDEEFRAEYEEAEVEF